jgi:predicted nucleic acid-binding protein
LILADTNVLSEMMRPRSNRTVEKWFEQNDSDVWLTSVVIAEIAFGIERIRPDERSPKLAAKLNGYVARFESRTLAFDSIDAVIYGSLMGQSQRRGIQISTPDGMIAAIALRNNAVLATRNVKDFGGLGVKVVNPWE